ncbi:NOL4 family protein [Megaselia abdita]
MIYDTLGFISHQMDNLDSLVNCDETSIDFSLKSSIENNTENYTLTKNEGCMNIQKEEHEEFSAQNKIVNDEKNNLTSCSRFSNKCIGLCKCDLSDFTSNETVKRFKFQSDKDHIFEIFQEWALKTYGDQSKTKTITLKKKMRILKALEGKEYNNPDSSKFRFWVRSKGFTTNSVLERPHKTFKPEAGTTLYVASTGKKIPDKIFRVVATVENFFEIIYNVHVELGGRNGRHAGQKRTYRIISETYAFLPREAVTKFLSICPECFKNLRQSSPYLETAHNSTSFSIFPKQEEPDKLDSLKNIENLNFYKTILKQLTNLHDSVNKNKNSDKFLKFQNNYDSSLCRFPTNKELDLTKLKPITSTYLQLTRSMGLSDTDALQFNDFENLSTSETLPETNSEDPYIGLMKDADKLKLMLLAWNYQNSAATRNGTEGPDLNVMSGLWTQYQNALAMNASAVANATKPSENCISPIPRNELASPMENQDETNSSGQKDEDEGSEDDSDDKLDQAPHDPERLKAFNMFVRLFVDENLDRMIPISKQPKEKIQAIIDSCSRQFPEFSDRSRKRIRTYLKSCRRNKKTRDGWENTSRPTPAHLTSVQAEQILAVACENESMNAKRMRVGLDPISQNAPMGVNNSVSSEQAVVNALTSYPTFRTTPNQTITTPDVADNIIQSNNSARNSPLSLNPSLNSENKTNMNTGNLNNTAQASSPMFRSNDFSSPSSSTNSPFTNRTTSYQNYFSNIPGSSNMSLPTDLSMKTNIENRTICPSSVGNMTCSSSANSVVSGPAPPQIPPLITHKLSPNEMTAARQVISAYRESAAFLLRTADQVEQLLIQQQQQ